jgi:hypothetical protein
MPLGYKTDENGKECLSTSIIDTRIKALDVELYVNVNKDLSYPLSSPHNNGFHVKVIGKTEAFRTEFNINKVATEEALIDAVSQFFFYPDQYVKIGTAQPFETFAFETEIYNRTKIDNKSYSSWDEDLEDLEDNANNVVGVFLNDHLRWEVAE